MITVTDFEERCDEIKNHGKQLVDTKVAEERNFALLGGSREKCVIIKEAIKEVISDLYAKFQPHKKEIITIPKAFQLPESVTKEVGEKESLYWSFNLLRTSGLIELLKTRGTLRKRLGKEEEARLYDDFYLCEFKVYGKPYNPFSILQNCLISIIETTKNNEDKICHITALPNEQKTRTIHLKKRETAVNWEKDFRLENDIILNKKLTSGKTVKEQYMEDRIKTLKEPIDKLEFKHRMNNLARTVFEDKLKIDPSFSGHEVEYRFTERKILEALTGKKFKDLSTYEKTKTRRMLFDNKDEAFTFFEKTADGQLKVVYWKLYDYSEYLLINGSTDIAMKFDLTGQDFRNKKSYIYSDDKDFLIAKQKIGDFWKYIEAEKKDDKNIKKIGKGLNRVKTNKIFQAAPIKLLGFIRLNFQQKHPLILKKETFDMLCGYIRDEAQSESLSGKKRPVLTEATVKVVRWMVLWVAKQAGWAYSVKVAKGNVVIKPNYKYFTKWQCDKVSLKAQSVKTQEKA